MTMNCLALGAISDIRTPTPVECPLNVDTSQMLFQTILKADIPVKKTSHITV